MVRTHSRHLLNESVFDPARNPKLLSDRTPVCNHSLLYRSVMEDSDGSPGCIHTGVSQEQIECLQDLNRMFTRSIRSNIILSVL